jgi:hypothetical protein
MAAAEALDISSNHLQTRAALTHALKISKHVLENFTLTNLRGTPFAISQCTTFGGVAGDCNSSLFKIEDVVFRKAVGTVLADPIASLQCSAAAPCVNIAVEEMDLKLENGTVASGYNCNDVVDPIGFNCTGLPCGTSSATGWC